MTHSLRMRKANLHMRHSEGEKMRQYRAISPSVSFYLVEYLIEYAKTPPWLQFSHPLK